MLNADDRRVAQMASESVERVVSFGTVTNAQVRADQITMTRNGQVSFELSDGASRARVELQLIGEHHLSNGLAAAAACIEAGLELPTVAGRLSRATNLSPHRMQVTHRPDGVTIIDDAYNANPDSMRAALKALAVVAGRDRRSIAVLGQMLELGNESRVRHDEAGRLAVRLNVRLVIVVGADAWPIFDGAQMEGSWGDEVVQVNDIAGAKEILDDVLTEGDVVLIKGSNGTGLWKLGDQLLEFGGDEPEVGRDSDVIA